MLNNHIIGVQARRPAANGISIVTPVSPQPPGTTLVVNGSYAGAMTSGTLVWRQGSTNVGTPVPITTIAGGAWSTTITTPATPGTYTLRARFNGTTPVADSNTVSIEEGAPETLASITFIGSGDGADTVVRFGHSFEQGTLQPTDPVLIQRADNNAPLRTQMRALATWPDGSVRTAMFACELPALSIGQMLQCVLRRGETHSSPEANLTWPDVLAGRSIFIRTWAPGNTATPLWSYDVAAALGSSTDDWFTGPLALDRRVITTLPASAVRTTSDGPGTNDSIRLVVDVAATKDGALIVDLSFRNDAVLHPNLGIARFGYTIEIDGQIVYDQRPATGPARDMIAYIWWVRRRGRKGTRVYDFHTTYRPLVAPDSALLMQSGFLLPHDLTLPPPGPGWSNNDLGPGASRLNDPYWPWGVARDSGMTGGRQEIGYRTYPGYLWCFYSTLDPRAQLLASLQAEAFPMAAWVMSDAEFERPILADEWPRFSLAGGQTSPAGTPRANANGPHLSPSPSVVDHMTSDFAHRGAFYATPALLDGRRQFYDLTAMRSAEMVYRGRNNNGTFSGTWGTGWRNFTPDFNTGLAWTGAVYGQQVRGLAWGLRDIHDAQYILPDNYPRRDFYSKNAQAHINMFVHMLPQIEDDLGADKGLPILHTNEQFDRPYMTSYLVFSMTQMLRNGFGGPNMAMIYDRLTTYRTIGGLVDLNLVRKVMDADMLYLRPHKTWAAVAADSRNGVIPYPGWNANANTSVGSAYNADAMASMALMSYWAPSVQSRAWARDALVLMRSHRPQANSHPRVNPVSFTGYRQTSQICPSPWTWNLNTAPMLLTPAPMTIPADADPDTLIGIIDWTGSNPRMTDNPVLSNHDSFQIVSQPAGNPFRVTRGGSIRRSNTGSFNALGPVTLQVRCRTFDVDGTERWSNTVTATVDITATAPQLSGSQSIEVAENIAVGVVVATFTYTGTVGTPSIIAGNTNNLFEIVPVMPTVSGGPNSIQVRVAASLVGQTATDPTLTIRVENLVGATTTTCSINIVPAVNPPVITPGQTFSISDGAALGSNPTPAAVAMTGDPPTSISLAGANASDWSIALSGTLTTAALLGPRAPNSYALTVNASNLGGPGSGSITINVTRPSHIWETIAPSGSLLGVWSVARRIVTSYNGALIRVRRASDNAQQDIGFDASGNLNTAALAAFVGSSQGFLTRVYDQAYNAHLEPFSGEFEITSATGVLRTLPNTTASRPCAAVFTNNRWMRSLAFDHGGARARYGYGIVIATATNANTSQYITFGTTSPNDDRLWIRPDGMNYPQTVVSTRRTGSSLNTPTVGTVNADTPLVLASRFEDVSTNAVRTFFNGTAQSSVNGTFPSFGSRNTAQFYGVAINNNDPATQVGSGHLRWSEAYIFSGISDAHIDAVITEQRTYYGV